MRIALVGPPKERLRLRESLAGTGLEIVDEAETMAAARSSAAGAEAFVVSAVRRTLSADGEGDPPPDPLTHREIDVLELLAEGLPNKAIARRLGISDQTVKFHVASIGGKLGASNRTEAVRIAIRRGLVAI